MHQLIECGHASSLRTIPTHMSTSPLESNYQAALSADNGCGNEAPDHANETSARSGLRRVPEIFARLSERVAPRSKSAKDGASVSVRHPTANASVEPAKRASELESCRASFKEWSSSLPKGELKFGSLAKRLPEKLRGKPKLEEGELFFVTQVSEEKHTGMVIHDRFTPTKRQVNSGQLLIDGGNGSEKPRWYFYANNDHPLAPADPSRPGKLIAWGADSGTLAHTSFTPSQSQLETGKYWLDSHAGVNTWYQVENPASLLSDAQTAPNLGAKGS